MVIAIILIIIIITIHVIETYISKVNTSIDKKKGKGNERSIVLKESIENYFQYRNCLFSANQLVRWRHRHLTSAEGKE